MSCLVQSRAVVFAELVPVALQCNRSLYRRLAGMHSVYWPATQLEVLMLCCGHVCSAAIDALLRLMLGVRARDYGHDRATNGVPTTNMFMSSPVISVGTDRTSVLYFSWHRFRCRFSMLCTFPDQKKGHAAGRGQLWPELSASTLPMCHTSAQAQPFAL